MFNIHKGCQNMLGYKKKVSIIQRRTSFSVACLFQEKNQPISRSRKPADYSTHATGGVASAFAFALGLAFGLGGSSVEA